MVQLLLHGPHGTADSISSDVKSEGYRPYEAICACQYLLYGRKEALVTTNLLHEQLVKDLFLCCMPKRDTTYYRLLESVSPCPNVLQVNTGPQAPFGGGGGALLNKFPPNLATVVHQIAAL